MKFNETGGSASAFLPCSGRSAPQARLALPAVGPFAMKRAWLGSTPERQKAVFMTRELATAAGGRCVRSNGARDRLADLCERRFVAAIRQIARRTACGRLAVLRAYFFFFVTL
jgi:hypothetical protein